MLNQTTSYLVYQIGDDFFASNSNEIRNIIDINCINSNNNTYDHINVGNGKIPLFRFGFPEKTTNENGCIVIMETLGVKKKKLGIIVNDVKKLIDISEDDLIKKPYIGINNYNNFIEDYIKVDNKVVGIVNLKKILQNEYQREEEKISCKS